MAASSIGVSHTTRQQNVYSMNQWCETTMLVFHNIAVAINSAESNVRPDTSHVHLVLDPLDRWPAVMPMNGVNAGRANPFEDHVSQESLNRMNRVNVDRTDLTPVGT